VSLDIIPYHIGFVKSCFAVFSALRRIYLRSGALRVLGFVVEHLAELRLIELTIHTAALEQLVVCTLLGNHAVLDHQDAVGLQNRGQAVRDDDVGAPAHKVLQRVLNGVFGDGVQGRGGLVQNQDARILEHHTRDGEALLLAAGELQAAVAHLGVVAVRLAHDEIVDVCDAAGGLKLLLRGVHLGIEQIVADRVVEEVGLLRHNADVAAQKAEVIAFYIDVVDADGAAGNIVEARDEVYQRGLAGAGGADNGVHLPGRDREVDVREQRFVRYIREFDVVKMDLAGNFHGGLAPVRRGDDGDLPVKVIEDAGEQGEGAGKVHLNVQQRLHRAIEAVDERDRGRDGADGEGGVGLGDDEPAARKIDQQGADLRKHPHHHAEPLAAALLLERKLRDLLIDGDKAVVLQLFAGEELDQQGAGDGQRLVDELVHLVVLGLALVEKLPAGAPHAARRQDQQGDDQHAHNGKLPAHGKERHKRRHHRGGIAHNARERAGDDGAYAGNVGIHARDDVALLFGGKEGVRHVLQMVIHLVFHVEDDALGNPGVYVALQHTDDLGQSQRKEGHEQQPDQKLHVLAHQRLIHHAPGDDGGQQPDSGGEDDCGQHQQKLQPVGLEVGEDPPQQLLRHLRHALFFFLGQKFDRPAGAGSACHGTHLFHTLFHYCKSMIHYSTGSLKSVQ